MKTKKYPPPGEPGSEENPIDLRTYMGALRLCCLDCEGKIRDTYLGDFDVQKTREATPEERKSRVMPTLEIRAKRKCTACHGSNLYIKSVTITGTIEL